LAFSRWTVPALLSFAAAIFGAGLAHAGLPLDFGVYRPQTGQLFLDLNLGNVVDRSVLLSPAPEYVLVADMNGDGIADMVSYRAGVWTIASNLHCSSAKSDASPCHETIRCCGGMRLNNSSFRSCSTLSS